MNIKGLMMKLKKILFPLISILFGIFLSIIILEVIFRMLPVRDSLMTLPVNSTNQVVRFKENRDVIFSHGVDFSIVTKKHVNNYGFLNDQDYYPEDESPLLAIIGDSYVEAAQVKNKNSMHGILSRETAGKGRVYSFGAAGSPLSTYLAYANYAAKEFSANALAFIIIGNDFDESLAKYKDAPGFHYFSEVSGHLDLVRKDYQPTLAKRLSRHSALIRYLALNMKLNWRSIENIFDKNTGKAEETYIGNTPANFDEERISDSKKAVDSFFHILPLQSGLKNDKILFVIDGMRPNLYNSTALIRANNSYFDLMRKYFIESAMSKGYEIIDMQPVFIKKHISEGIRFEFPSDGHWNEAGHDLVAEKIKASAVYKTLFEK